MLEILFRRAGYEVVLARGHGASQEPINKSPQPIPVVLTDLRMPDGAGLDVLAASKARDPTSEVVLITAHSTIENAIEAMRAGAYDFVTKPPDAAELVALIAKAFEKQALNSENARLRALVQARHGSDFVVRSRAMKAVLDVAERVAQTRSTVLITGESGTGKERIARSLHACSDRASGPCLVVNCGARPDRRMESALFGHEQGAFTGATSTPAGLLRQAEGGSLLLDEVGELTPALQVKLLRVLQERAVRAVGGTREVSVDVRVLAATNRDIETDVATGRFRQDLYYRLNVIRLRVPPLRARREAIASIIEHFIQRFSAETGKVVTGLTPDAVRVLVQYSFPGNVRELENVIERAVVLSRSRLIGLGDLPPEVSGLAGAPATNLDEVPPEGCDLDAILGEVERRLLVSALDRTVRGLGLRARMDTGVQPLATADVDCVNHFSSEPRTSNG